MLVKTIILFMALAVSLHAEPPTYTLDQLIKQALKESPALRAKTHAWKAQEHKISGASSLPDPQIQLSYFLEEVETRVGPQEAAIAYSQKIPWLKKLELKQEVQSQKSLSAKKELSLLESQISERVTELYLKDRQLFNEIKINKDIQTVLKSFEDIIRQKIRNGAKLQDLINLQIELAKISDSISKLKQQQKLLHAELLELINVEEAFSLNHNHKINSELPPSSELVQTTLKQNPTLIHQKQLIKEAQSKSALANTAIRPDFSLGVKSIITGSSNNPNTDDNGKDPLIISVGFSLPIFTKKYDADKASALEAIEASRWSEISTRNKLTRRIKQVYLEIEDIDRNQKLFTETLVPKIKESLKLSQQSYRNNQSSFLEIFELIQQNLAFELQINKNHFHRLMLINKLSSLSSTQLISTKVEVQQ